MSEIDKLDLKLNYRKKTVPVLYRENIEEIAKYLISRFDSELLKKPRPVDIDEFAEFFLEVDIENHLLSHNFCYFGMYVFNDSDVIPVYDAEKNVVRKLTGVGNTVLLDNRLYEQRNENLRRFTLAHECSHALLHHRYYRKNENQLSLFNLDEVETKQNVAFKSSESTLGPRPLETDHDWIEWQANTLASCLLMNKDSLSVFLNDYSVEELNDPFSNFYIVYNIADVYEVSVDAARVRLKTFLKNESKPENEISLFD